MYRSLLALPLCLLALFSFSSLNGQAYQFFTNPTQINIPDIGPGSIYPSLITVSGQPAFLHDVKVHFESAEHLFGFADVDILLEAPNGQKVVLCSNAGDGVEFMFDLWFGNSNLPLFTYDEVINNGKFEFRPTSFELKSDTFPAPGPGIITQHSPSLQTLDGINPNGVWKLWVVSDKQNGATGNLGYSNVFGDFGWELAIKADATQPCARPERPEAVLVEDTFAMVRWPVNGTATHWDLYYGIEPIVPPDASTVPTLENVGQSDNVLLPNLIPDRPYSVWVRSNCGVTKSDWIGPLNFQSKVFPCRTPYLATICKPFDLFAVPPFYNWLPDACTGLSLQTPKRMVQFTAPATGLYNITGLQGGADGHAAYKVLGTCDSIGWTCTSGGSVPGYEFAIDLAGGVTYWFYFEGMWSNHVVFNACPFALDPGANVKLVPIAVSPVRGQFRWSETNNNNQPVPGDWDILYQPAANPSPGFWAQPSETAFQTDDHGLFWLQQSIQAGTDYDIFIRRNCGNIWTCWGNPVEFETPKLTSTAAEVRMDSSLLSGAVSAFLSWKNTPDSAVDISWEASWGYTPFSNPEPEPVNINVESRVWAQLNGLSPSRDYDLWLRPRFPSNILPLPYWIQEWQGPFPFTTPDHCGLITDEIYCMEEVRSGFLSGNHTIYEHFDLPPTVCAADTSESGWEVVYKFRSPITGPVNIVPTDAVGRPGRECLVFYKKTSQGCWAANGWENIGCWEMGSTPSTLTFEAEQDTLYYLAFDTRRVESNYNVDDFGFRLEACPHPCPVVKKVECISTDATSAVIRWNSLGPGSVYTLEYYGMDSFQMASFVGLTDTVFTITDLSPTQEYGVWVIYTCNGKAILSEAIRVRIGSQHPSLSNGMMSDCNPLFVRPGGQADRLYSYDMFAVEAPLEGDYTLEAGFGCNASPTPTFVSVYEGFFDPENPLLNLLAFTDSLALTIAPTQLLVHLLPGHPYQCVVARPNPLYSQAFTGIEQYCLEYEIRGPGFAQLYHPLYQGRQTQPHGVLEQTSLFDNWPDYSCIDTAGWVHYYRRGADANRYDDDHLLLSIQDYGEHVPSTNFAVTVGNGGDALQLHSPPATYTVNPTGWFVMDRYWDVLTSFYKQPTAPVLVRFYFTQEDFQALRDSVLAAGGIPPDNVEQLYFYKINDFFDRYNPDPIAGHVGIPPAYSNSSDGYWEYKNGPEATDSTWRYEPYLNGHLAETLVHHFSGGGGGVGGNLLGAITSVRPLTENPKLNIYPNPTTGWLTLDGLENYPEAIFQISDMMGRVQMPPKRIQTKYLDISMLPPGSYFLILYLDGRLSSWQIIKQ